jgi:hypothetical protein
MDLDEIKPAASCGPAGRTNPGAIGGRVPATPPDERAPASRTGGRGPRGTSNSLIAIVAALLNSSMATSHPAAVAVIVTVAMLTAALVLD